MINALLDFAWYLVSQCRCSIKRSKCWTIRPKSSSFLRTRTYCYFWWWSHKSKSAINIEVGSLSLKHLLIGNNLGPGIYSLSPKPSSSDISCFCSPQVQEVWKHISYTLLNKAFFVLEFLIPLLAHCMFYSELMCLTLSFIYDSKTSPDASTYDEPGKPFSYLLGATGCAPGKTAVSCLQQVPSDVSANSDSRGFDRSKFHLDVDEHQQPNGCDNPE